MRKKKTLILKCIIMINIFIYPDSLIEYQKEKGKENVNKNKILCINNIKFNEHVYSLNKMNYVVYFIDMYYKNSSILLQLPKCIIDKLDKSKMIVKFNESDKLFNFLIDPLEKCIKNTVYNNSEKWFGKKFTMNKIDNCFVSPFSINELTLSIEKSTLFFNKYKKLIDITDITDITDIDITLNVEITPLIKIANLQFIQNKFSYDLVLEQSKVLIEETLVEYSIIDSVESISSDCSYRENEYYIENKEIDSVDQNFF